MTTFADMLFHLGGLPALQGIPFSSAAKYFFVDPARGSDGNDGLSPDKALAGLEAAYAKCTANQHDTIFYIAGATSLNLAAAVTWAKSYTHLVGICAPSHAGQRARIFQTSTLTGASPLITVSGSGCIFKNLYIFQGVDDATSLINVSVTGSRNYFHNVHFAGGGNATQAINGGASLYINGGSENLFEDCTIGVDTVEAATGMMGLLFAATGGAARNVWRNCRFTMNAGHAGAGLVETMGTTGTAQYQIFDRCLFLNISSTAMTSAFVIAAGHDARWNKFILRDCTMYGATDWDASDRSALYLSNGTITGGGNAGIAVVSAAT